MIREIVKFNCHILKLNTHDDITTPEMLFEKYNNMIDDLIFENIKTEVVSCQWASGGKSTILTKVKRVDDDIRNKQKGKI